MGMKKVIIIVAAAVGVLLLVTALQDPPLKFGVVDLVSVADKSLLGAQKKQEFDQQRDRMLGLLQYLDGNRAMTSAQADRLRELMLRTEPSDGEKTELENLKKTIGAQVAEMNTLIGLTNHTEAQTARLGELSRMQRETVTRIGGWNEVFLRQISLEAEESRAEVLGKAREAAEKVGKRDGYTIVFDKTIAPYAANDLSDETIKQMDADNP
ncbi:MAG: hypothetical protein IH851_07155 [Armatimonadetes bacterium]|nr:hypothetical protein [Armatimonadota bacterium]